MLYCEEAVACFFFFFRAVHHHDQGYRSPYGVSGNNAVQVVYMKNVELYVIMYN